MRPILLGLTGGRNVGKSSIADVLVERHGFFRAHVFDGGKAAGFSFLSRYVGPRKARRMVWGDLKDRPCPELPGGVAPRFFFEKLGRFMGVDGLGVEWTLGLELSRAKREADGRPIVFESVVYEAPFFQGAGGFLARVVRPGHQGPVGIETDAAQARIRADGQIVNGGTLADLEAEVSRFLDLYARWRLAAA